MSRNPFQRAVGFSRRPRYADRVTDGAVAGQPELQSRHPAMRGISVSPVHGWHCICDRCTAQAREPS